MINFDRFAEAYAETHKPGEDRMAYVAFAALAVALGCPDDAVGTLWNRMITRELPRSPQAAVEEFRQELATIIEGRSNVD